MEYEAVIGLEVHVQLNTETKIFCNCSTEFGAPPNTHICPVCTGQPGVLPVLNKKVVEYAIKAALALNCEVANFTKFDRKNYFYPDLPKAYQISQYDLPLGSRGYIWITLPEGAKKKIGITRIHMEEDAGKLVHSSDDFTKATHSFVDYNRAGVPLLEIVSEPDLRTPQEAYEYLIKLKTIMRYIGVSDCNMEEGSLRCDANVSVRPKGQSEFGTKTEVKNMNSFKNVMKALEYEIKRQIEILKTGGKIVQETRLWDANQGRTFSMRSKEESHDYRYFPEPDLVPVVIDEAWKEKIKQTLPEMPDAKKERFLKEYSLPEYDASVLTVERDIADYFEALAQSIGDPKMASNWVMGEVLRRLNERQIGISEFEVAPERLAELLKFVKDGKISNNIAKKVFEKMVQTGDSASAIIEREGLVQMTDAGELEKIIRQVIEQHPNEVQTYKAGKTKVFGFFMGQIMKATRGKANPQLANQILKKLLDEA